MPLTITSKIRNLTIGFCPQFMQLLLYLIKLLLTITIKMVTLCIIVFCTGLASYKQLLPLSYTKGNYVNGMHLILKNQHDIFFMSH